MHCTDYQQRNYYHKKFSAQLVTFDQNKQLGKCRKLSKTAKIGSLGLAFKVNRLHVNKPQAFDMCGNKLVNSLYKKA